MMSILDTSPVFICGHPKSGTSLLRNLLDSHPQLLVFPEETTFFRQLYPRIKDASLAEAQELAVAHLTRFFEWNQQSPPEHQAGFYDRDYSHVDDQQVKASMRAYLGAEGVRHSGDYLTAAARALALLRDRLPALFKVRLETEPSPGVRLAICEALEGCTDDVLRQVLEKTGVSDPDARVRSGAMRALNR